MSITWKGKAALSLGLSAAMIVAVGGGYHSICGW